MKEATSEKAGHRAAFEEFDSVIAPENRMAWKAEMEAWEENPNDTMVSNPLQPKSLGAFNFLVHLHILLKVFVQQSHKPVLVWVWHGLRLRSLSVVSIYYFTPTYHQACLSDQGLILKKNSKLLVCMSSSIY